MKSTCISVGLWATLSLGLPTFGSVPETASSARLLRQTVVVHHRYRAYPRWGYRTTVIPRSTTIVYHERVGYRYANGVFYKPLGRTFVVVPPPVGLVIPALPAGFVSVTIGGTPFFYHYGTYYVKVSGQNQYRVVPPPAGAQVDSLPQGYEKIVLNGQTYYVLDGIYYQALIGENGEVLYEVVGNKTRSETRPGS